MHSVSLLIHKIVFSIQYTTHLPATHESLAVGQKVAGVLVQVEADLVRAQDACSIVCVMLYSAVYS
jgi:hypothetical protein